jgi:hypothetical protein
LSEFGLSAQQTVEACRLPILIKHFLSYGLASTHGPLAYPNKIPTKKIINALASDPVLSRDFRDSQKKNSSFKNKVLAFTKYWPIFSSKEIRKHHLQGSLDGKARGDRKKILLIIRNRPPTHSRIRSAMSGLECGNKCHL